MLVHCNSMCMCVTNTWAHVHILPFHMPETEALYFSFMRAHTQVQQMWASLRRCNNGIYTCQRRGGGERGKRRSAYLHSTFTYNKHFQRLCQYLHFPSWNELWAQKLLNSWAVDGTVCTYACVNMCLTDFCFTLHSVSSTLRSFACLSLYFSYNLNLPAYKWRVKQRLWSGNMRYGGRQIISDILVEVMRS